MPSAPEPGTKRFADDYLLYLLARTSHVISAEFHDRLRARGVSVPVWRVLASLMGSEEGETVTGLADRCLLQQPTMTKLLDRMVRDDLVQRAADPHDRRVVRVRLTAAGGTLVAQLAAVARAHEVEVLARHPEAVATPLKDLLRAILDRDLKTRRG